MPEAPTPAVAILRLPQVIAMVGLRKTAIYSRMKAGAFPQPVDLGGRAVGWRLADVNAWMGERRELNASERGERGRKATAAVAHRKASA